MNVTSAARGAAELPTGAPKRAESPEKNRAESGAARAAAPSNVAPFAAFLRAVLGLPGEATPEGVGAAGAGEETTEGDAVHALHYGLRTESRGETAHGDDEKAETVPPGLARGDLPPGAAHAAAHSAVAEAARAATAAVPVGGPVADTDAIAPELRARLQRVVDRMRDEHGYDVTVVETARSQERQDLLYEQGRTRSGEVVTWTRDSQHVHGRAADVMVNGGYDDAAAFRTLQQVAREEGLRTLGMRDPGHLELPRGVAVESMTVDARPAPAPTLPPQASGVAQIAQVASVAAVAQVANVA